MIPAARPMFLSNENFTERFLSARSRSPEIKFKARLSLSLRLAVYAVLRLPCLSLFSGGPFAPSP